MLAVLVRDADLRDLDGLMRIEEECFGAERFSPETVRSFIERDDTFVLVAVEDDRIIGSSMCMVSDERGEGRVASVAVLPSSRRKGIGAKLLEGCEKEFMKRGLTIAELEVDVENEPAIKLYLSKGYDVRGLIEDFYGAGRDAYAMARSLLHEGRGVRVKVS